MKLSLAYGPTIVSAPYTVQVAVFFYKVLTAVCVADCHRRTCSAAVHCGHVTWNQHMAATSVAIILVAALDPPEGSHCKTGRFRHFRAGHL